MFTVNSQRIGNILRISYILTQTSRLKSSVKMQRVSQRTLTSTAEFQLNQWHDFFLHESSSVCFCLTKNFNLPVCLFFISPLSLFPALSLAAYLHFGNLSRREAFAADPQEVNMFFRSPSPCLLFSLSLCLSLRGSLMSFFTSMQR